MTIFLTLCLFLSFSNSFSWGCVKSDCRARFTQQEGSDFLKEERPHTCDIKTHVSLEVRLAREMAKSTAANGKARTPLECYSQLNDE